MKTMSEEKKPMVPLIFSVILCVLWSCAIGICSNAYALYEVSTDSMNDTLCKGDIIAVKKGGNDFHLKDVVIYRIGNKLQCKRIAALPGDVVDFEEDGRLVVNGHILNENYAAIAASPSDTLEPPYTLKEGTYFVLGDNRADSIDSRAEAIAGIERDAIIGKVIFRVWPLKHFGRIGGNAE